MAQDFFQRLKEYYKKVAEVLRGEAEAAAIFPNSSDIGNSRENIYAQFLKQHAPSKCNVFFGGFLFDEYGNESKQMDVLVTTDTTPQFNFHNKNNAGKSFCPVEGSLAVASIKSTLDKKQLEDSLLGIASIPPMSSLEGRVIPLIEIENYDHWPLKIVYASKGINGYTLLNHINSFYEKNPQIENNRKPDIIHVAGQYLIMKTVEGMMMKNMKTGENIKPETGGFGLVAREPDVQAIVWTLDHLQSKVTASQEIMYSYSWIVNKTFGLDYVTTPNNDSSQITGIEKKV